MLACLAYVRVPAQSSFRGSFQEASARGDEREVEAAAMRNPTLALRQTSALLPLPFGKRILERLVAAAPDEAMALAERPVAQSRELHQAMTAGSAQLRLLAAISELSARDLLTRRRVASLTGAIVRGVLTWDAAWNAAANPQRYFAELADLRAAISGNEAAGDEAAGLDRALEIESANFCLAAQQSGGRSIAADAAGLRTTDVYLMLAYGRAQAPEECAAVFARVFDRELAPKLKRDSLAGFLERTHNWKLREFASGSLNAGRFPALLAAAGTTAISNLASHIDEVDDGVEVAEMIGATRGVAADRALIDRFAAHVAAGPSNPVYGLLAARLLRTPEKDLPDAEQLRDAAAPYSELLASSEMLDTRALFDSDGRAIERYFFWDDDDGVESFANFRRQYERDPAWKIEDGPSFVRLTGHGEGERTVEIYANIPIDLRRPENRMREGEAQRRQASIGEELSRRGLKATVLVHRGHSFHVAKTLEYITPDAQLVVLGSCRGVPEIHHVIEASHRAQVIATHGVGATGINDGILKGLNARLLSGAASLRWSDFWREQQQKLGKSGLFRDYVAPDRDEASAFLRAYYMALDRDGPTVGQ
jgi:hypothetical protein